MSADGVRVDHGVSSGTFSLDGQTFGVVNNIWVVGDDRECIVIDAPHNVDDILAVVAQREVKAIICTHAHDDHVRLAPSLSAAVAAPVYLHPEDAPVWALTHGDEHRTEDIVDGQEFHIGGTVLRVLHTPGHSPGSVCPYAPDLACVFTGDTLFKGGPGATGRSFSDEATIRDSIQTVLFALPAGTVVHTGHGDDTTIGEEKALITAERIRRLVRGRLPGEEAVP